MGPIGMPEAVFILILAFLLFGPKKLPEMGRTVGKALADFQRAKGELTAAFERETKQLGLDAELTSFVSLYQVETSAPPPTIDASSSGYSYQSLYGSLYGSEAYVPAVRRISAPEGDEPELLAMLPENTAAGDSEEWLRDGAQSSD